MRIYICAYLNKFVKTKDKRPTPLSSVGSTSSGSKDPCDCKIPLLLIRQLIQMCILIEFF